MATQKRDSDLLAHMAREDLLQSVRRAQRESEDANSYRDALVTWALRLLPYLNDDPHLTIAQALDRYWAEHAKGCEQA